jgi:hypothetical protein
MIETWSSHATVRISAVARARGIAFPAAICPHLGSRGTQWLRVWTIRARHMHAHEPQAPTAMATEPADPLTSVGEERSHAAFASGQDLAPAYANRT